LARDDLGELGMKLAHRKPFLRALEQVKQNVVSKEKNSPSSNPSQRLSPKKDASRKEKEDSKQVSSTVSSRNEISLKDPQENVTEEILIETVVKKEPKERSPREDAPSKVLRSPIEQHSQIFQNVAEYYLDKVSSFCLI
jgi:hypothetical protein